VRSRRFVLCRAASIIVGTLSSSLIDRRLRLRRAVVGLCFYVYTAHTALRREVGGARGPSCLGGRDEVLGELLAGSLREVRAYHRGGFRSAAASEPTSFPGGLIFIVLEIPRGFFEGVMPPPRGGNQRLNRPLVTQVQVEEACGARAHTGQGRLGLSLDLSLARGDQGRLLNPSWASL
jgi:hypothetical protein